MYVKCRYEKINFLKQTQFVKLHVKTYKLKHMLTISCITRLNVCKVKYMAAMLYLYRMWLLCA